MAACAAHRVAGVCLLLFLAADASRPFRRPVSYRPPPPGLVSDLMLLFERPYAVHQVEYDFDFQFSTLIPSARGGRRWSLPRGRIFSHFSPSHRQQAKELLELFRNLTSPVELLGVAQAIRNNVNENMFIDMLARAIMERPDLQGVRLPSIVEIFPQKFVPATTIGEMLVKAQNALPGQKMIMTEYGPEFTGTDSRPEHRVAYWREDYAINEHHWHWHLVNPFYMVVDRDRKGELFYYMHQQMVARYDMERLSVGLVRVKKFNDWGESIPDGYFSKLTVNNTGTAWGTRQDNSILRDCDREEFTGDMSGDVEDMELYHHRILDAIHQGALMDRHGGWVVLTDDIPADQKRGIERLGDAFEASTDRSVNFPYYGEVHNYGHMLISAIHDPDYFHKEELAVMSDPTVAVRDPIFFRWHKFVDDVFQKYKLTQRPYSLDELTVNWAKVVNVSVMSTGAANESNQLYTGWSYSIYNASKGIDFQSKVSMMLNLTHLDHNPFYYTINVANRFSQNKKVTVRIFLAPKYNERQLDMDYADQRSLWSEMDKFVYELYPGLNTIRRSSLNSSVANIYQEHHGVYDDPNDPDWVMHGCGWPQHLLLPRGDSSGMPFQFFVMLTDYEQDKVVQPPNSHPKSNAASLCGVEGGGKYPDSRPMGFPFDRIIEDVGSVGDLTRLPNIAMQEVTITFTNSTITKLQNYGGPF